MKTIIIGFGNLGKIYASSLLKYEIIKEDELYILKRNTDSPEKHQGKIFTEKNIPAVQADVIFLSVKPQDFKSVLDITRKLLHKDTLIISVMAGITIDQLSQSL